MDMAAQVAMAATAVSDVMATAPRMMRVDVAVQVAMAAMEEAVPVAMGPAAAPVLAS